MTDRVAYFEIAVPELGYLTAGNGGARLLNATVGCTSYFERADVIDAGLKIQSARREAVEDPEARATLERYFDAAGALITSSATSFAIHSSDQPGLTALYFASDEATVEVDILDGRVLLALRAATLTVTELLENHLGDDPDVTIVGRFTADGRRYLAISRGVAAHSDDGRNWTASNPGEPRDPNEILRQFAAVSA
jgi:hypothetical protein